MHNVILTGIPRSGTTLAAALIDSLPNAVCLNEPLWQTDVKLDGNPQALALWLRDDFARLRQHLLAEHPIPDRRDAEGKAITNFFKDGKPVQEKTFGLLIRAGLTPDFTLAVKHNALFMAALPHLALMSDFLVIALLRHPVATIASWQRVPLPVAEGRMPHAATYWPKIKSIGESNDDVLIKQVKLYDALCGRLAKLRGAIHIVHYELLITNPNLLCDMLRHDGPIDDSIIEKTQHEIPAHDAIVRALNEHGQNWQKFYPELT